MSNMVKILLVEDNPADIELTKEAFEISHLGNDLFVVEDGQEALDYLFKRNGFEDAERPGIVLLDINLPHINGFEVLKTIKENEQLKTIPVIMLTSSDDDKDIFKSYENYCSGFISKPVSIDSFIDVANRVEGFWFGLVKHAKK